MNGIKGLLFEFRALVLKYKRREIYILNMVQFEIKGFDKYIEGRIKKEKNAVYNIYSATLKNERIRLNMTLEDMTKNICSKSYLSKIENNLLSGDEYRLRLLFERVNINYNDLELIDKTGKLNDCIKYYLYGKFDAIEEVYNLINVNYFIARDSIVKMLYCLVKKDYDTFVIIAREVEEVKQSLTDPEMIAFVLITIEYLIQTYQFLLAQKYITIFQEFSFDDYEMNTFFEQQRFIVACNLQDTKEAYKYYFDLSARKLSYPFKQKFLIKVMFLELFNNSPFQESEFKNMIDDYIPDEYYEDFYYSVCLNTIKLKDYNQVIEIIINKNLRHPQFVALFGYALLKLKKSNREITKFDQYFETFWDFYESLQYCNNDRIHFNFIKYITMELKDDDKYEIFDYLKNFLIINIQNEQHRFYSPFYSYRYFTLLGKRSRYKDAFLFAHSSIIFFKNSLFKFDF